MIKLLSMPEWKRAAQKMVQINVSTGGEREMTDYNRIHMLVSLQIKKPHQIDHYLKAMKKSNINPELLLKYIIIIHTYIQTADIVEDAKLYDFLGEMVTQCTSMVSKYIQSEEKRQTSFGSRSVGVRSSTSTRQDEIFVSKEIFLITAILKPYIGFLMKLISVCGQYKDLKSRKGSVLVHQAWMMINLLKIVTSISNHFTMIGRYFMKQYGHLVVLLTKAMSIDINKFTILLKKYVITQNSILSCSSSLDKEVSSSIQDFIKMLEEISKMNEELLQVYLGKYFYKYLSDLTEPNWINTNSKDFDTLYGIWKQITHFQAQPFDPKKRSRSLNLQSSTK